MNNSSTCDIPMRPLENTESEGVQSFVLLVNIVECQVSCLYHGKCVWRKELSVCVCLASSCLCVCVLSVSQSKCAKHTHIHRMAELRAERESCDKTFHLTKWHWGTCSDSSMPVDIKEMWDPHQAAPYHLLFSTEEECVGRRKLWKIFRKCTGNYNLKKK